MQNRETNKALLLVNKQNHPQGANQTLETGTL